MLGAALADSSSSRRDGGWYVVRAEDCAIVAASERRPDAARGRRDASIRSRSPFLADPDGAVVTDLALTLVAAECAGIAAWCVETAAEYARVREQFGRPIGQFQAVKHRCADMLLALEQARAVAWDAARPGATLTTSDRSTAAVAGALAPAAVVQCAKDCIQVLGGIGFTWEHDAHLYLKRATAMRALTGGGPHPWRRRTRRARAARRRRTLAVDLPPEAEPIAPRIRAVLERPRDRTTRPSGARLLADAGYLAPHWPAPWGRDASAVEQLVIDEELRAAHVRRPHLAGRRVGAAHAHRARHRRAAAALGPADACGARSRGASCSASRARAATSRR